MQSSHGASSSLALQIGSSVSEGSRMQLMEGDPIAFTAAELRTSVPQFPTFRSG